MMISAILLLIKTKTVPLLYLKNVGDDGALILRGVIVITG